MKYFWDKVSYVSLLIDPSLIVVGDLNLTLYSNEVWGSKVVNDTLDPYLKEIFERVGLFHVPPTALTPTWSNDRMKTWVFPSVWIGF